MSENMYQLSDESDQDDQDYLPKGQSSSASEEESDIEDENLVDAVSESDENFVTKVQKRSKKLKNKISKRVKNQKTSPSNEKKLLDTASENDNDDDDEAQKKRTDSLWADFLKDSAPISKAKSKDTNDSSLVKSKIDIKIKNSTTYEFAGEKVDAENKALLNTTENNLFTTLKPENKKNVNPSSVIKHEDGSIKDRKTQRMGGGISAVLCRLEKKTKINTLEKSKMDWDNFKKQEDIEEEINSHNKGKDGYLEKQDFLQRADFRQFEIEKQLRNSSRRSNR